MNNVNHPKHYEGKIECIDAMQIVYGEKAVADFCILNAFKYIWRMGKKDGNTKVQDFKKAKWYYRRYFIIKNHREPTMNEMKMSHIVSAVSRFKDGGLESGNGV